MGEPQCVICGRTLPQGDHGARRRRYCENPECRLEGRRRAQAARQGRDPERSGRRAVKTEAALAAVTAPASGGRAWTFYSELLMAETTSVSYDEAVAGLGGTSALAQRGLVQLERLGLLVGAGVGRRQVFEVRAPASAEARSWVAACAAGGRAATLRRLNDGC